MKSKLFGALQSASEKTKSATAALAETVGKSKVTSQIIEGAKSASSNFKESAVGKKVGEISSYTTEKLDQMAGSHILELVEERLETQKQYNDILATKLEEALQRIEALESKLDK